MRHAHTRMASLLAGALLLGGCATSPEEDPVQIRLNDLDARLQRIERVMTNQSLLEMAQRIDALQAQLRTMRGEVEMLQNQSEGGKSQTRTLYADLEKRIAALEAGGGLVGADGGAALPPASGGEQAAYDAAFNSLKNADYPKAIASFKNFLATYPDSPLASNAQYWLGEAYYVTREYPSAITAFQQVVAKWPDSRKAPDAMVKVGFTQSAMGRNGDARVTLEDVVKRYPGTEAAQLATERLKRLPANGR
ncbi:MAG TPA: tol-pal system protein YbgF [Steroidobacteraceae bacterium]|nr:tol-pal system protein YbgF [Steroidobacteraceae bacterium]